MEDGGDGKGARSLEVSMAITIDLSRGIDVMRGAKILAHFATREEAVAYIQAAKRGGLYMRYWAVKGS